MSNVRQKRLGILGGMGPLASAEFLKTIYEYNPPQKSEQDTPQVILYSDPSFPDRTEAILRGDDAILRQRLIEALEQLSKFDVSKIAICCITSHYLLPSLPQQLRQRIVNLIDVSLNAVAKNPQDLLLICTEGTVKMQIFQTHPLWDKLQDYIRLPNSKDQELVQELIYRIKHQGISCLDRDIIQYLQSTYQVNHLIAGCTEIHLLSKFYNLKSSNPMDNVFLDPLTLIAQNLYQYL